MKKYILPILLFTIFGLLAAQWALVSALSPVEARQENEKMNLALRQVGHQLLTAIGNDTSNIPPVVQVADNEFMLRLEHGFNYDTLPFILADVFKGYNISGPYRVAIKNCGSGQLVLGYDHSDVPKKEAACMGRDHQTACSNISVVFDKIKPTNFYGKYLMIALATMGVVLLLRLLFFKNGKIEKGQNAGATENAPNNNGVKISLGHSILDLQNQLFETNNIKKQLTFREAKLLHFFMQHPNHILDREKILSNVWEDEGVIVGRSLDVFVSRLRKTILADPSLQIKNIHGVGYKLEVDE